MPTIRNRSPQPLQVPLPGGRRRLLLVGASTSLARSAEIEELVRAGLLEQLGADEETDKENAMPEAVDTNTISTGNGNGAAPPQPRKRRSRISGAEGRRRRKEHLAAQQAATTSFSPRSRPERPRAAAVTSAPTEQVRLELIGRVLRLAEGALAALAR